MAKENQSAAKPQARQGKSRFVLGLFVVLAAVLVTAAYRTHGTLPRYPPGPRHETKQYTTFSAFYVHYRTEHSDATNHFLHTVGTAITIFLFLLRPRQIVSLVLACAVGYMLCEVFSAFPNGFIEMGIMFSVFIFSNYALTRRSGVDILLVGYGLAWVGHFYYQKNRPATFIYPSFSLMSDYLQFSETMQGKIPLVVPPLPFNLPFKLPF